MKNYLKTEELCVIVYNNCLHKHQKLHLVLISSKK